MDRNSTLRERVRIAADDAAKLSLRLAALARRAELEATPDAEVWLRYAEGEIADAARHMLLLERDSRPEEAAA